MIGERHLLPVIHGVERDADVQLDEDLTIRIEGRTLRVIDGGGAIRLADGDAISDVTGDAVGAVSNATGLDLDLAEAVLGRWLAAKFGGASSDALARRLEVLLPGIARLRQHHGALAPRTRFSGREVAYLRADTLPEAASAYWGDACGAAAGRALRDAVVLHDTAHGAAKARLGEDRIGLLHLVHDPALRLDAAAAVTARSLVVPHPDSRIVTASLSPRVQVDFVVEALQRAESRQLVHIAFRLGIEASGANGRDAYHRLAGQVRAAGFRRPSRVIDQLAADKVAGRDVRVIESADEVRRIGREANNCLRNDVHGWPKRVESGRAQLAVLGTGETIEAILALSADGSHGLELRSPGNGSVAPDLRDAIRSRLREITGTDYPMPAHLNLAPEVLVDEPW